MAFIRNCSITAVMVFCILLNTNAQTVYYPAVSSKLLKSTAEDAAMLLQKAVTGSSFTAQSYTGNIPAKGIIFIYDTTITDNQACRVENNGYDCIKFIAAEDNGLHFGIYQYLNQLGFRFYQPGSIWEITPKLSTIYKKMDTVFTCAYKYKSWFISGSHNRWVMDNTNMYAWDAYFGDNGHNWALYQRRNGMLGAARFNGHRDDIMRGDYLTALQNNPCYVANFDGSRQATAQSVPDVFNTAAKDLWANTIEKKYTAYKNNIYINRVFYTDIYRNFKYNYGYVGLEVPDVSRFGNSKENDPCNAVDYPKESDQHFMIANHSAEKILATNPGKRFHVYAYSGHADIPSAAIAINKNIDIQLVSTVYQMESSTNGLRNRWYNRSSNISEYLYLNLSGWSGETPSFRWDELKTTLQIAKEKKSQGMMWEASPAKFGSLPVLLAANSFLKDGIEVDSTLHEFCNNMFGAASNTVYTIFKNWGEENTALNKYKLQLYIRLMNTASQQTKDAPAIVKERLQELKAYFHYMMLYFNMDNLDLNKPEVKAERDAVLCLYLAKTNRMQLVNSYFLITNIVRKYETGSDFYVKYNVVNGTAYQNGNLPLITAAEVENNFSQDVSKYSNQLEGFAMEDAAKIQQQFTAGNIAPLTTIKTKIYYTNGANNYNKTTFSIIASAAGNFTIEYTPGFDMAGKGYINFLVESADKTLQIVKDFNLDNKATQGSLKIDLPQAGNYILTIVSKYKSTVDLSITTNGNYFYKSGAFLGNKTETYKDDWASLPGYFYVPAGISKIYCNVSSFNGVKYAAADAISRVFAIKDQNGKAVNFRYINPLDSSLMVLDIPEQAAGSFWQVTAMAQYNMHFINISNVLWYAQRTACSNASFTATVINKDGNCVTRLTSTAAAAQLNWLVNNDGTILKYSGKNSIDLPGKIADDAVITLSNGSSCVFSKRLGDDAAYLKDKENCAAGTERGTAVTTVPVQPVMYPNPSAGIFNCMVNGQPVNADEILVFNTQGTKVGSFKNVNQFNLSNTTAGMYLYQMRIDGKTYNGKVVKL
jgi:hypothetical protein